MKAALILLLLGQQAQPVLVPREVPCIRGALLTDAGVVDVGSGTWFCELDVIEMGKDHANLRKTNEELEKALTEPESKPTLALAAGIGIVLGLVVGGVAGFAVARQTK